MDDRLPAHQKVNATKRVRAFLFSLPSRRGVLSSLVILIPAVLYCTALNSYFTSEDFGLIRRFSDASWLNTVWHEFYAPFLDLSYIKFYRPISTFLFGLEALLFGDRAMAYTATHVAVHLLNALLLFRCVARMLPSKERCLPFCAALLFALYPLHPNTVLKTSGYATLFCSTFLLLALSRFLAERRSPGLRNRLQVFFWFFLALASYEVAVVFPVLLLGFDLLAENPFKNRRTASKWIRTYLPFAVALAIYLLLRRQVLGVFIGGYEDFAARWYLTPGRVFSDLFRSWIPLFYPSFESGGWRPGAGAAGAAGIILASLGTILRYSSRVRAYASLGLVALIWIVVCQAPFCFTRVVPANARYWYVASMGLALGIAVLIRIVSCWMGSKRIYASATIMLALSLCWMDLLITNIRAYREAWQETRQIQAAILDEADAAGPDARFFLAGYPTFVLNSARIQMAPVLAWGLSDLVRPPFTEISVPLYPLPRFDEEIQVFPLAAGDHSRKILFWDGRAGKTVPFRFSPRMEKTGSALKEITVQLPCNGRPFPSDPSKWELVFQSRGYSEVTLFVVAPNFALKQEVAFSHLHGPNTLRLPPKLEIAAYYDLPVYGWLVAKDERGITIASSRLMIFTIADPP